MITLFTRLYDVWSHRAFLLNYDTKGQRGTPSVYNSIDNTEDKQNLHASVHERVLQFPEGVVCSN